MFKSYKIHRRLIAYMLSAFAVVLIFMALVSATWAECAYKNGVEDGRHTIKIEYGKKYKICELTEDLKELNCE